MKTEELAQELCRWNQCTEPPCEFHMRQAAQLVDRLCGGEEAQIALAQAVAFAIYVQDHAKGGMKEAAQKFLSQDFAQTMRERLKL